MGTKRTTDLTASGSLTGAELLELSRLSTTIKITATTLSAAAADNSYNDSGAGFVTAGFAVGNRVNVAGFTGNVANNIFVGVITALTAGKMTIGGTDGDVIVDDAAGESVTITKWVSRRTTAQAVADLSAAAIATAVVGLFDYKSATDCSGNPNYPAALKGDVYVVSVSGKIGGASGTAVTAGDWYIAEADNAGGTEAAVGASWGHIKNGTTGAYALLSGATFTGAVIVPADAYGAGWNGSNQVPTKNDVYDKIEAVIAGVGSYTDENARDAVMAMLIGSGLLVETENDAGDTDTLAVNAAVDSDIWAGSSTTKAVTPKSLADAAVPQTLTDAAPTAWDMSLGYNAKWTLGGSHTLSTPTNPKLGFTYTLNVIQDGTGSRLVTWPASFDWGTAGAPTLTTTASKRDRITLFCTDAATPKFDAFLSGKGFS